MPFARGEAPRYRLYIDESGDHTFSQMDSDNARYLALMGVWFNSGDPYKNFAKSLADLKAEIFGWHPDDDAICLHRKDIVDRKGIFRKLHDPKLNQRFEDGLIEVVRTARFYMACVVIDKVSHATKTYRELVHPYHYCVAALLERYAGRLERTGARGDVMAESRGGTEDRALREAFEETLRKGTYYHSAKRFQGVITSTKIKLKKKEHAIAGLELADLLAYPLKREIVAERRREKPPTDYSSALLDAARSKMNRNMYTGRTSGYGKIWLD